MIFVHLLQILYISASVSGFVSKEASFELGGSNEGNTTSQRKLRHELLRHYDRYLKPSTKESINVNVSLNILDVNVNYARSIFSVNVLHVMEWYDEKLRWDPSRYGGLSEISVANHEIWRPDIRALNSAEDSDFDSHRTPKFLVTSLGKVSWMPFAKYKVFCSCDLTNWPFDSQQCLLSLGSHSHNMHEMDLTMNPSKVTHSAKSSKSNWKLKNVSTQLRMHYDFCEDPYIALEYSMIIEKVHQPSRIFIYTPVLVLSVLLFTAFWIPISSSDKMPLIAVVLLTSILFLIFFCVKIPIFSCQVPNMVKFYSNLTCWSIFYLMIVVCLQALTHKSTKYVPVYVKRFLQSRTVEIILPDDFLSSCCPTGIDQRIEPENKKRNNDFSDHQWYLVATLIDRFFLIIFTVILIYLNFSTIIV